MFHPIYKHREVVWKEKQHKTVSSLLNIFLKLLWGLSRVTRNQLREQDRIKNASPLEIWDCSQTKA